MDLVLKLREAILNKTVIVNPPVKKDELYQFLGSTKEERVENLLKKIITSKNYSTLLQEKRKKIFEYIIDFWEQSTISIEYKFPAFKGINLAHRPFIAPTGSDGSDTFAFGEQYRWDTFFQNRGLLLAGGIDLAFSQLLNLTDVFNEFKRIPNALVTPFLSRPQPPFEMVSLMDLLKTGLPHGEQVAGIVRVIEEELVIEWFDYGSGKQNHRQSQEMIQKYGLLTRYEPHSNPFIVGCEDGKDHNWITATYSYEYLPVQLNSIIYGTISSLYDYYASSTLGNNKEKADLYDEVRKQMYFDFQKVFWNKNGVWEGFRDYSLKKGKEEPILYGNLSAEVFPLFFRLATQEQAEKIKNNLNMYYSGDIGLAVTSLELRKNGSIPVEPLGQWKFQWEYPNCWPPLMMIAVDGLKNYGYGKEALQYEKNWIRYVESEFKNINGFAEKYPFSTHVNVEPGFYGNMKGFGWTVATYLWFLHDLAVNDIL